MVTQQFNPQRLNELEELLELEYEQLHEYGKALITADGISQKIKLKQQLKRDLLLNLSAHEREYAELLAAGLQPERVPEIEAAPIILELTQATTQAQSISGAPTEMLQLLTEIKHKLDEPGKSAAAKLKVALPIIPLIARYELELDTENFLTTILRKIRQAARNWISRDPR